MNSLNWNQKRKEGTCLIGNHKGGLASNWTHKTQVEKLAEWKITKGEGKGLAEFLFEGDGRVWLNLKSQKGREGLD